MRTSFLESLNRWMVQLVQIVTEDFTDRRLAVTTTQISYTDTWMHEPIALSLEGHVLQIHIACNQVFLYANVIARRQN